jgi:hypothetical protein
VSRKRIPKFPEFPPILQTWENPFSSKTSTRCSLSLLHTAFSLSSLPSQRGGSRRQPCDACAARLGGPTSYGSCSAAASVASHNDVEREGRRRRHGQRQLSPRPRRPRLSPEVRGRVAGEEEVITGEEAVSGLMQSTSGSDQTQSTRARGRCLGAGRGSNRARRRVPAGRTQRRTHLAAPAPAPTLAAPSRLDLERRQPHPCGYGILSRGTHTPSFVASRPGQWGEENSARCPGWSSSMSAARARPMLTVQNRVEVHRKRTSDLVPFSPKRVLQGLLIQGLEANR